MRRTDKKIIALERFQLTSLRHWATVEMFSGTGAGQEPGSVPCIAEELEWPENRRQEAGVSPSRAGQAAQCPILSGQLLRHTESLQTLDAPL